MDRDRHHWALLGKDAALRRNAVRALESSEAGGRLFFESGVVNDPDLGTRLAAFVKLTPNAKLAIGFEQLVVSPMPPMHLILKPQEIEDVIAYLLTLKTAR